MVRLLLAVFAFGALSAGVFAADTIYRNDFTSRESAGEIPMLGVWQTAEPYPPETSALCYTPWNSTYTSYKDNILGAFFHAATDLYAGDKGDMRRVAYALLQRSVGTVYADVFHGRRDERVYVLDDPSDHGMQRHSAFADS